MKYKSFWLFTNRNCMVFDPAGNQVPDAQSAVSCYDLDPIAAQAVLDETQEFYLCRWNEWSHPVTKRDIEYLLGLRTRERDLAEG